MEISEFVKRLNIHTKAIYLNEVEEVDSNANILNWLLGLAGGGLLFSFDKYTEINDSDTSIIILQSILFLGVIVCGYKHRQFTKLFKSYTTSITRMFDLFNIELELIPKVVEDDISDNRPLREIFDDYLNGEYFNELDQGLFYKLGEKQMAAYSQTKKIAALAIMLLLAEYSLFFLLILI